jgi:hypothetical protein
MSGVDPGVLRTLADLVVVSALALLVVRPALWGLVLLAAQAVLIAMMPFPGCCTGRPAGRGPRTRWIGHRPGPGWWEPPSF